MIYSFFILVTFSLKTFYFLSNINRFSLKYYFLYYILKNMRQKQQLSITPELAEYAFSTLLTQPQISVILADI